MVRKNPGPLVLFDHSHGDINSGMGIFRDLTDCELRQLLKLQFPPIGSRVLVGRLAGEIDSVRKLQALPCRLGGRCAWVPVAAPAFLLTRL
jgi:hypothetical protein